MTKAMVRNHDLLTGEITERQMTTDELAQSKADIAETAASLAEEATKAALRQAVLDKLALTAEEIAALLS